MAEERITEVRTPDGNTHTHTTVVEGERRGGGGWLLALILLVVLGIGLYFFANMSNRESAKDNAIAEAARDVGGAAQDVGDAAKDAARKLDNQ